MTKKRQTVRVGNVEGTPFTAADSDPKEDRDEA
jgi:hypothetical protein